MARVFRSRRAEEDLLAIAEHIAIDNQSAGARWLDEIEQTIALLAEHSMIGESVGHI